MTTPNDLPPVGATVTDADGVEWTFVGDHAGRSWQIRWDGGSWHVADSNEVSPLCFSLWRERQARLMVEQRAEKAEVKVAMLEVNEQQARIVSIALRAEVARLREDAARCVKQEVWVAEDGLSAAFVERRVQHDGSYLWAVVDRVGGVLDKSGMWWVEPSPSERSDEYLASTRWATRDAAINAARAAQGGEGIQEALSAEELDAIHEATEALESEAACVLNRAQPGEEEDAKAAQADSDKHVDVLRTLLARCRARKGAS